MVQIPSVIDASQHGPAQMLELLRTVGPVAAITRPAAVQSEPDRQAQAQAGRAQAEAANDEPIAEADIEAAVEEINIFLLGVPTHLQFRVDDALDRLIVSVVDSETGEILRQLPPDEVLKISQRVREADFGLLDSTA